MAFTIIRWGVSIFLALVAGLIGLSLFFSDLGPGETMTGRLIAAAIVFVTAGFLIGLINPLAWPVAGLTAWGTALLGLAATMNVLIGEVERSIAHWLQAISLLALPLLLALAGAWIGSRVYSGRPWRT